MVREDAKMALRTAGVTGMRLGVAGGEGCGVGTGSGATRECDAVMVEEEVVVAEEGMVDDEDEVARRRHA